MKIWKCDCCGKDIKSISKNRLYNQFPKDLQDLCDSCYEKIAKIVSDVLMDSVERDKRKIKEKVQKLMREYHD